MTVETILFQTLQALVAGRVYPDVAPENAARPYITYQQLGGEPLNFVDAARPSKRNGHFQVSVWADARLAASALAAQVEDALRAAPALQTTVLGSPMALNDDVTKLRGTAQDFSFWVDA